MIMLTLLLCLTTHLLKLRKEKDLWKLSGNHASLVYFTKSSPSYVLTSGYVSQRDITGNVVSGFGMKELDKQTIKYRKQAIKHLNAEIKNGVSYDSDTNNLCAFSG